MPADIPDPGEHGPERHEDSAERLRALASQFEQDLAVVPDLSEAIMRRYLGDEKYTLLHHEELHHAEPWPKLPLSYKTPDIRQLYHVRAFLRRLGGGYSNVVYGQSGLGKEGYGYQRDDEVKVTILNHNPDTIETSLVRGG
jgi:hypothetical protein